MAQPRVILGWLAFAGLLVMSVRCLIRDGELSLEAWTYLLMTPLALALALTPESVWTRENDEMAEFVEEEQDDAEFVGEKNVPDPVEDGFDVPVL